MNLKEAVWDCELDSTRQTDDTAESFLNILETFRFHEKCGTSWSDE